MYAENVSLRLQILQMALTYGSQTVTVEEVIKAAEEMYKFVTTSEEKKD